MPRDAAPTGIARSGIVKAVALGLACLALATGCSEGILIKSYPSGADVYMNREFVGRTPLTHWVRRSDWSGSSVPYEVKKTGYETAQGELDVCVGGGRIASGLMTAGTSWLFKRPTAFCKDEEVLRLNPLPLEPLTSRQIEVE